MKRVWAMVGPQGRKPPSCQTLNAALKRRSSTVIRGFGDRGFEEMEK